MQMEVEPRIAILQDLRLQSFDAIRFASYRTASKLRYIQKSTNCKYEKRNNFRIKLVGNNVYYCPFLFTHQYIWSIFGMSSKPFVRMDLTRSNHRVKSALPASKLSSPHCITILTNVFPPHNKFLSTPKPDFC